MSQILYSFVNKDKKRYFVIWNCISELPVTIPLNLINLIQYKGAKNKGFLEALHDVYPDLIRQGCSVPNKSFDQLEENMKAYLMRQTALLDEFEPEFEASLIQELHEILYDIRDVDLFFDNYNHITTFNHHLPRPVDYYLFTDALLLQINKDDRSINGDFLRFEAPFLAQKFVEKEQQNEIKMNSIPHLLRGEIEIENLFNSYGMQNYLPKNKPVYKYSVISQFRLKEVHDSLFANKQFLNHNLFWDDLLNYEIKKEIDFYNKPISELSIVEIEEILDSQRMYQRLVNFEDENGNIKFPQIYTKSDIPNDASEYLDFLCYGGVQLICVFFKSGELFDQGLYNDVHTLASNVYVGIDGTLGNKARLVAVDFLKKEAIGFPVMSDVISPEVLLDDTVSTELIYFNNSNVDFSQDCKQNQPNQDAEADNDLLSDDELPL